MKRKYYLILALTLIGLKTLSSTTAPVENEVEFDLNTREIKSTQGVDVNYGDTTLKVFDLTHDEKKEKIYIPSGFSFKTDNLDTNLSFEAKRAELSTKNDDGTFYDSFNTIEVGKFTGAEKPNDKIYFGGKETFYNKKLIKVTDSWLTTDPKVNENRDLKNLGYYLKMDEISIIPDKHLTLEGIDLVIQDRNILPFAFPWYRFNIRSGSEVPLFPEWGDSDDYGFHIGMGTIYESKDGKFKGGFSPKFADEMGLLVGRFENWYTFDEIGETRLNVTDFLAWKKEKDNKKNSIGREDESFNDRWDVELTHKYEGEKGHLDFGFQSLTYNMNEALEDVIEDYDSEGRYDFIKPDGSLHKGDLGNLPDMGDVSNYYTLDTSLKELGENKDISIDAKVKLTDDKEAYHYIVADKVDGLGFNSQTDNDLFADVKIEKDNDKYNMSAYYNYLYDADRGSNINDMRSEGQDFGFAFNEKEKKISMYYDEVDGDKFRRLNSWERNPSLSHLLPEDRYGLDMKYSPWTVEEYKTYDSVNYGATFGEYKFIGDTTAKYTYSHKYSEKDLSLENDPFREAVFGENSRISQYNYLNDTVYEEIEEDRIGTNIYSGLVDVEFAGGKYEETIISRKGRYDGTFDTYKNESDFYEVGLAKKLSLGNLGEVSLLGNIRKDEFKDGSQNNIDTTNDDSSTRYKGEITHTTKPNTLKVYGESHTYDGDDKLEYGRLINKENIIGVEDELSFETGNIKTTYSGKFETREEAYSDEKNNESFKNKVSFEKDGEKLVSFYYNEDGKYVSPLNDENYKSYEDKDMGVSLYKGNHEVFLSNRKIDNFIDDRDLNLGGSLNEEIRENTVGYVYSNDDSKIILSYTQGKDEASLGNQDVLDINNRVYSFEYIKGTDVINSFGISYGDYQGDFVRAHLGENNFRNDYNSDVLSLNYSYKDKRLTEEELAYYASREFDKPKSEVTTHDINKMRNIFDRNNEISFDLGKTIDERIRFNGDAKRSFDLYLSVERNKSDYVKNITSDDTTDFSVGAFYSQNRIGFGYIYSEETNFFNGSKDITEKEHELSFHAKFGKPSEGWRTKMYAQFNGDSVVEDTNNYIKEAGILVGKEMGYYEWSVAYTREYSLATRDYEWNAGLQFTLLTFPDKPIFGIGAKRDRGSSDDKVKPNVDILSGIKVEDIK